MDDSKNAAAGHRWTVCALLFAAISINYIDRQTLALLKPLLEHQFAWSDVDYSHIVFMFTMAYAIGAVFAGRFMDRVGTRKGFSIAVTLWSVAAAAHAIASSIFGFTVARVALGLGESGAFPAGIKTVSEWFPQDERSFATGIFNAGTSIGTIATPLLLPLLVLTVGWRWSFVVTASLGFIWLVAWLRYYRPSQRAAPDLNAPRERWTAIIRYPQAWAFVAGKFFTDPVWFLYLFWLPDFLHRTHGLDLVSFGIPLAVIYVVAGFGSIGGGWLSGELIRRGWSANRARKTAMIASAVLVVPTIFAPQISSLWAAVAIISLAAAAHQTFSANLFTLTSDMFESSAVGAVTGLGAMAGSIGGMLIALFVGQALQRFGNYEIIFFIPTAAYIAALIAIQLFAPRLEPAGDIKSRRTDQPVARPA